MKTLCPTEKMVLALVDGAAGIHVPRPRRSELWERGISEKL